MEMSDIIAMVFRWLHIIPMTILVGGSLFLRLSLAPASQEVAGSEDLREAARRRWAKWIGISILFLLVSGLYNLHNLATNYKMDGIYLGALAAKVLIAFFIFYLASVLGGRSNTARKFREKEMFWLNVLCGCLLATVMLAGFCRTYPIPAKVKSEAGNSSVEQPKTMGINPE